MLVKYYILLHNISSKESVFLTKKKNENKLLTALRGEMIKTSDVDEL